MDFFSFGPNCHAAGILKMLNLRKFSLPFDWAQSGSIQHVELLDMTPEAFYYRHIHSPSRILTYERIGKPDDNGHAAGRLKDLELIYGYNSFFNPHRVEGAEMDYFLRCITRAQHMLLQYNRRIVILVAEHIPTANSLHLIANPHATVDHIISRLQKKANAVLHVLVMKTYVHQRFELNIDISEIGHKGGLLEIRLPTCLNNFGGSADEVRILTQIYSKALCIAQGLPNFKQDL